MTASAGTNARTPARGPRAVLICDELSGEALEVFAAAGIAPRVATGLSERQLIDAVGDVAVLVVRSATRITRAVIEAAPHLELVARAGVGVDNVDLEAATDRGVLVMNAPAGNTTTTAELAIAHLCALARHIPRADRAVRAGQWKKKTGLMGTELAEKTLGVIGLGRIGRAVAQRARGLSLHVLGYDPYLAPAAPGLEALGVERVELDELLARSDFVTLHVPLTDGTRHLIDAARLASMKRGARLINCARGGLVDEAALADALASGHLRGAALDVFEEEPPRPDHPLLARDDVILTPHLGASSDEAQRNVAIDVARQVCDYLVEGTSTNTVNAPPLTHKALREIGPYLDLARRLGHFLGERGRGAVTCLEMSAAGELATADLSHVRLALLAGLLGARGEPVNAVNAPARARVRGLEWGDLPDEGPNFLHSRLSLRAHAAGRVFTVAGSVFGRTPRVVEIDGAALDLDPVGALITTHHLDRPGVVGLIGTVLGRHGVNIRRVELGPPAGAPAAGGLALGYFALYDEPAAAVIDEIAALEPVRAVELTHFGAPA